MVIITVIRLFKKGIYEYTDAMHEGDSNKNINKFINTNIDVKGENMKSITQKPWFGKKRVGYGPAPAAWQGWIVTLLFVLTVILDFLYFRLSITTILIFIVALVVFFVIASLTGGPE